VTGCGDPGGSGSRQDGATEDATRTVATERGDVLIPDAPQRVACVDWQMAPAMVDLDVLPVGIYEGFFEEDASFVAPQRYVDALADVERFGSYETFSAEALAAVQPDLVLTEGVGLEENDLTQMEEIAPLVLLSSDGGWRDVQRRLADVLERATEFAALEKQYEEGTAEVREKHAETLETISWASVGGGLDRQWFLEGGATPTGTLLSDIGATFADVVDPEGYWSEPRSYELLSDLDAADVILYPADDSGEPVAAAVPLLEDPLFQKLRAVKEKNVFGFRHSNVSSIVWAGDGTDELAEILDQVSR
jgi:iron complex transport system substrate-binding protein